ncbi:hypothetical protein BDV19DRAFT_392411 [Aspergillus venezuelensis]
MAAPQRHHRSQEEISRGIRQIWAGELPKFPVRGAPPPLNLNDLAQYPFAELVKLMARYPKHADAIFQWGRSPNGLWPHHAQFADENALVAWHATRAPGVNAPFTMSQINRNLSGTLFPITVLIELDAVAALAALHRAGHWVPMGYTANGGSYLLMASNRRSTCVLHYILSAARRDLDFARRPAQSSQLTAGVNNTINHVDLIIQNAEHQTFTKWWSYLQTASFRYQTPIPLHNQSQIILCRAVTRHQAERIRICSGINLAHVNATTHGTVWHLALSNRNTDFLDFLNVWAVPSSINSQGTHMETPLQNARTTGKTAHFRKLLSLGAECDAMVRSDLMAFPSVNDKWLIAACAHYRDINPSPGQRVQGGTLLHTVISGISFGIDKLTSNTWLTGTQKARQRKALIDRAKRLIYLVRAGSRHGRPDLATQDSQGRTASDLVRGRGYRELEGALQVNRLPGAATGPQRGHRYETHAFPSQLIPVYEHTVARYIWSVTEHPTPRDVERHHMLRVLVHLPVDHWVKNDRLHDILIRLQGKGYWDPLAYSIAGETYYSLSDSHHAEQTRDYTTHTILKREAVDFCQMNRTAPSVTGFNSQDADEIKYPHIDILIREEKDPRLINEMWDLIAPGESGWGDADNFLSPAARRRLCELTSKVVAEEEMLRFHYLDLARVIPGDCGVGSAQLSAP